MEEKIKRIISESYDGVDKISRVLYPSNIKITKDKNNFLKLGTGVEIEKDVYEGNDNLFEILPLDIPNAEIRALTKEIVKIKGKKKVSSLKELKKEISIFGKDITILMNIDCYLEYFSMSKKGFDIGLSIQDSEIRIMNIPLILIYEPDRKKDIFLIKKDLTTIDYSKSNNKYSEKLWIDTEKVKKMLRIISYVKIHIGEINPEKVKVLNLDSPYLQLI